MKPTTYLKLIAGSLPEHGQGSVDDSLRILCQAALGTAQIHYVRSPTPVEGMYHYLAIPSSALSSEPRPTTPLAMALPGHPGHLGPGAYLMSAGVYKVAALFDGQQLDIVCNEAALVDDLLQEQNLPIVSVSDTDEAWALQSEFTRKSALTLELTRKTLKISIPVLTLAGLLYAGLMAADGWMAARLDGTAKATEKALADVLTSIHTGSPLSKQLADYQQRGSVAVRAGGWIDAYQFRNKEESFRIFVPSWVTPDYIESLGAGVVADKDPADEQLLVLVKGEPPGGKKITSADSGSKAGAAPGAPSPAQAPAPALKPR